MPRSYPPRQVWVGLCIVYGPPDDPAVSREAGLVLTGRLTDWVRALDGRWLGVVSFAVRDTEGARRFWLDRVLVPAEALAPVDRNTTNDADVRDR